jgi:hypothetical protein
VLATPPGHVCRLALKPRSGHACPKSTAAAPEAACRNAARHCCLSVPRHVSHATVHHRRLRAGAATLPLATAALTLSISPRRFSPSCRSEVPGRTPPPPRLSWCQLTVALHSRSPSDAAPVRPPSRRLSPRHRATVSSQRRRLTPSSSPQVITQHEARSHRHLHWSNDAENNNTANLPPSLEQVLLMLAQMLQTMQQNPRKGQESSRFGS